MNKILNFSVSAAIFTLLIISINSINFPVLSNHSSPQEINTESKDSLFKKSHDVFYNSWVKTDPLLLLMPTGYNQFTISSFTNINITQNTFPQNEPSIKISRKNPNVVVAAWRDFRTGVEPAIRRVGYSRSTDGGFSWAPAALLPSFDSLHPLNSDPAVCTDTAGNFYISTIALSPRQAPADYIVAVYKSTNSGISFDNAYNISPHPDSLKFIDDKEYITCDLSNNSPFKNNIYVVWSSDFFADLSYCALVRSTNGGLNWSERIGIPEGVGGGAGFVPAVGLNGVLYVICTSSDSTGQLGIYLNKSTNGGASFEPRVLISNIPNGGFVLRLPTIATDISNGPRSGYVYASWSCPIDNNPQNDDEDIFFSYSSNGGANWSSRKRVNDDAEFNGKRQYFPWMTCNEQGNIYITFYDTRNTPNKYIIEAYLASSTDGGLTFRNDGLSTQQSPTNYPNLDIRFGDYIGIDSWGGKVIPVWTDERAGNFDMEIYTAPITDSVIGIKPISEIIPQHFHLYQNYPNPFNPVTKIRFDIASNTLTNGIQNVKLDIYDILGREITTLVNENLKPGSYEIEWNASQQASGVYFYRLIAGENIMIKKMIVLK